MRTNAVARQHWLHAFAASAQGAVSSTRPSSPCGQPVTALLPGTSRLDGQPLQRCADAARAPSHSGCEAAHACSHLYGRPAPSAPQSTALPGAAAAAAAAVAAPGAQPPPSPGASARSAASWPAPSHAAHATSSAGSQRRRSVSAGAPAAAPVRSSTTTSCACACGGRAQGVRLGAGASPR